MPAAAASAPASPITQAATPAAAASGAASPTAPLAAPPVTAAPPTPSAAAPGKGLRILLVDEDGETRRQLREGLTAAGFRVLDACDGETALEYIRRIGPDAVVLELAVPRLDGFGILRALQGGAAPSGARRPPCVVLTVQDDPDVAAWVRELGAAAYLVKPVPAGALAARLRTLLEAPPS
jgi:PleD family two-component response regulator